MRPLKILILLCLSTLPPLVCGQSRLLPDIEPGVAQDLAEQRKSLISNINYQLDLDLPAAQNDPIQGRNVITFDLSNNSSHLVLDFRESAEKILSVQVNEQQSEYEFAAEHLIIPSSELIQGSNRIVIELSLIHI